MFLSGGGGGGGGVCTRIPKETPVSPSSGSTYATPDKQEDLIVKLMCTINHLKSNGMVGYM